MQRYENQRLQNFMAEAYAGVREEESLLVDETACPCGGCVHFDSEMASNQRAKRVEKKKEEQARSLFSFRCSTKLANE